MVKDGRYYNGRIADIIHNYFSGQSTIKLQHSDNVLSDLEFEFLGLHFIERLTYIQIGDKMKRSPHTVKGWKEKIKTKTGIKEVKGLIEHYTKWKKS